MLIPLHGGLAVLIVCAWCGIVLAPGVGAVSHGICGTCAESVLADALRSAPGAAFHSTPHEAAPGRIDNPRQALTGLSRKLPRFG